jgi:hypothetical protein
MASILTGFRINAVGRRVGRAGLFAETLKSPFEYRSFGPRET